MIKINKFFQGRITQVLKVSFLLLTFQLANVNTISAQDNPTIKEGDRLRITVPKMNLKKQVILFDGLNKDILNAKLSQ